jgi:hypothetical protein
MRVPLLQKKGVQMGSKSQFSTGVAIQLRRVAPAIGLFFVAPLVAEFLLGNMTIKMLGMLAILAPVYGGAAVLIRESVRRAGRGWASILALALAYGILEEAFLTETLFNPNYMGLNLHLLEPAFIAVLGIGGWYTVFVLTLHTVWSVSVSIALIEALVPDRATSPWIGRLGLGLIAAIFTLAAVSMASFSIRQDYHHFAASRTQFLWSAITLLILIVSAFRLPLRSNRAALGGVPPPWAAGFIALVASSAFLLVPMAWGWLAVGAYLLLDAAVATAILVWAARRGWDERHKLALAGGAAMAYAWHAFIQVPALGTADAFGRIGNMVFAVLAVILIAAGAKRTANFAARQLN